MLEVLLELLDALEFPYDGHSGIVVLVEIMLAQIVHVSVVGCLESWLIEILLAVGDFKRIDSFSEER